MIVRIGAALLILGVTLAQVRAQTADAREQSLQTLMNKGFKVVAVTFRPAETRPDKQPVYLVTLQSAASLAVCIFGSGQWENLTDDMARNSGACEVRTY